jgi:hypothetical protein
MLEAHLSDHKRKTQAHYRDYLTLQMEQQREQNRESTEMTKEEKRFNKFELKVYKRQSAGELIDIDIQDSVLAPKVNSV